MSSKMWFKAFLTASFLLPSCAQQILSDPGTFGPELEIVHLYNDQWPTGIAVSSTGRKFSNYPPALDPQNQGYTVAELTGNNTEIPFPSVEYNNPPSGRINYTTYPATSAASPHHLTGVQSVVIDPADRLWILDTGRTATPNGTMLSAAYGGPKLVGVDLSNNSIFTTIVFTPDAAPADSYLNDVRFDLSPSLTTSGKGVAYISDSSSEGRNAIVIVDLGTGEAWRHLINIKEVSPTQGFLPNVWGQFIYQNGSNGMPANTLSFGVDGIALSTDGSLLYFSTTGGPQMYSVPTALLRSRSANSELQAQAAVRYLGSRGLSDGMETDSNNNIYFGVIENNAIGVLTPETGTFSTFVRDPRFSWTDTFSAGADGYLYFTENQLWRTPTYNQGVDRRVKPFVLFRVKLPNDGKKVTLDSSSTVADSPSA